MESASTAVLGAGLMGTALARRMLETGRAVTTWNRSPEKCVPLVEEGAVRAGSIAEAMTGSTGTLVCIRNSADLLQLLRAHAGDVDLSGRWVADLSSGGNPEARKLEEFVQERGGAFLTGSILVTPANIGTADAVIQYAGSAVAWSAAGDTLTALAPQGALYLGEELDLPSTLDVAVTVPVLGVGLVSFLEGAAFAATRGVPLDTVLATTDRLLDILRKDIHEAARLIASGDYSTDQATVDVWRNGAARSREATVSEGLPAFTLGGAVAAMDRARERGYGGSALGAVFAAVRGGPAS